MSAVMVGLVFAVTACSSNALPTGVLPMAAASPASPAVTVTPDPTLTRQVCQSAASALAGVSANFQDQLDAIDRAAATGDHTAIMTAADAIQTRLLSLANLLSRWSREPVQPKVRTALAKGASTLQTICSPSYSGNQADIARQLQDLSRALGTVCG